MKKTGFYIDVNKAVWLGIIDRVTVTLNGKRISKVLAAKSGKNGFVEYYEQHPKVIEGNHLASKKVRGLVKISIRKEFKLEEGEPLYLCRSKASIQGARRMHLSPTRQELQLLKKEKQNDSTQ